MQKFFQRKLQKYIMKDMENEIEKSALMVIMKMLQMDQCHYFGLIMMKNYVDLQRLRQCKGSINCRIL